jgi:hypothetical protein
MRRVAPAAQLIPVLQFDLNRVKNLVFDDGRVAALHIVLRHFTFVHVHLLGQEVSAEGLLQDGVAVAFLIGENAMTVLGRQLGLPPGDGMPRSMIGTSARNPSIYGALW